MKVNCPTYCVIPKFRAELGKNTHTPDWHFPLLLKKQENKDKKKNLKDKKKN